MDLQLYTLELSINGLLPSCFLSFQYKVLLINSANFCNNFSHFIFNFKCIHTPKLSSFKSYCWFLLQIFTLNTTTIANNNLNMAYVQAILKLLLPNKSAYYFRVQLHSDFQHIGKPQPDSWPERNVSSLQCRLKGYSFFLEHAFYCLHFC